MLAIAVDDERIALEGLLDSIKQAAPQLETHGFRYAEDALAFAKDHVPDVAFLDIEAVGKSGIDLARDLKDINPRINIVFATGHTSYRGDAFDLHASGYMMKPITPQKVAAELAELRHPGKAAKRVRVQTFGNFEVYVDGAPLNVNYSKAKELLAYLVDRRGALCTLAEIAVALFSDDADHISYLKRLRTDLVDAFEAAGCGDVLVRQRGKMGVVADSIDCDYYAWLAGDRRATFTGEYMAQYSWAEPTCASLTMTRR